VKDLSKTTVKEIKEQMREMGLEGVSKVNSKNKGAYLSMISKHRSKRKQGHELKAGFNRAHENRHKPLTRTPTLRKRKINGEDRLVWISKDPKTDKVSMKMANPRQNIELKSFRSKFNAKVKQMKDKLMKRVVPRVVKNSIGEYAKDPDHEWGGGIDYEYDSDEPEQTISRQGERGRVNISKMNDMEIIYHTQPIGHELNFIPSATDLFVTRFNKPQIVGFIDNNSNRKRYLLLTSIHEKQPVLNDQKMIESRLEEELGNITMDLLGSRETVETKQKLMYQHLRKTLNELGYDMQYFDPSRTEILMKRDEEPEITVTPGLPGIKRRSRRKGLESRETIKRKMIEANKKRAGSLKKKRTGRKIGEDEEQRVANMGFQIYNIGMMAARRNVDLPDDWTDHLDPDLSMEENFEAIMDMQEYALYSPRKPSTTKQKKSVTVRKREYTNKARVRKRRN